MTYRNIRCIRPVVCVCVCMIMLYGCNGASMYDMQGSPEEPIDSIFRFIHISDVHGSTVTIDAVNEYCDKHFCDFVILTGDVSPDEKIVKAIAGANIEYYVIPGNHDAYEKEGPGQFGFRNSFQEKIGSPLDFPYANVN